MCALFIDHRFNTIRENKYILEILRMKDQTVTIPSSVLVFTCTQPIDMFVKIRTSQVF